MRLKDSLAPPLSQLLTREEWNSTLKETRADCGNCNQARGVTAIYKEGLKCCTFFPFVPNFLLGAILDSSLPGRTRIADAITGTVEMKEANFLPLGLMPSITYQRRFHAGQPDNYGNDESLLCPHFLKTTGGCGIWSVRPSPCRSFFCESSYGLSGIEFWAKFEKFVSMLETALAHNALLELGFDEDEVALSTRFLPRYAAPDPHGFTGEKLKLEISKSWAEFGADRIEFYRKCYRLVSELKVEDVKELLGDEGKALEDELFSVYWPRLLAYART